MKLHFKGCYLKFLSIFLLTTNLIKPTYAMNSINDGQTHLSDKYIDLDKYSQKAIDIFNYDQKILHNAEKKYEESISFSDLVSVHQNIINVLEHSDYYLKNYKDAKFVDVYDSIIIFYNWLNNDYRKDSRPINLKALYERIIFYFFVVEVLTECDIRKSINYIFEYHRHLNYDKLTNFSKEEAFKLFSYVTRYMMLHLDKQKIIYARLYQINDIIQNKKFRTYEPVEFYNLESPISMKVNKFSSKKTHCNSKFNKKIIKSKVLYEKSSQSHIELKEKYPLKSWRTIKLDDVESIFIIEQSKASNSFNSKDDYKCTSLEDLKKKLPTYDIAKKFINLFISFLNKCKNFNDAHGIKILIMRYDNYISLISSFLNIDCSDLLFDYGSLIEKYGDVNFEECKEVMVAILSELIA